MNNKSKIGVSIGIIILLIILFFCRNLTIPIKSTKKDLLQAEIDDLNSKIYILEEDLSSALSKLDDLQRDYKYSEDLVELLQKQLESHGIEPYEL